MDSTCVNVPFIVHGPNVIPTYNGLLLTNMSIVDAAPIAVNSLGLPTHYAWTGRSTVIKRELADNSSDDPLFYGMVSLGVSFTAISFSPYYISSCYSFATESPFGVPTVAA
jgi:hypothetical protein